jgi:BolA protein
MTMPISVAEQIHNRLADTLQTTALQVIDESHLHAGHAGASASGIGSHFRVKIASPLFTSVSRVQRHRLVYDALQDFIDQGLHALAIEVL